MKSRPTKRRDAQLYPRVERRDAVHRRQVAASAVTEQKHTAFLEEAKKPSGEPADISQADSFSKTVFGARSARSLFRRRQKKDQQG